MQERDYRITDSTFPQFYIMRKASFIGRIYDLNHFVAQSHSFFSLCFYEV